MFVLVHFISMVNCVIHGFADAKANVTGYKIRSAHLFKDTLNKYIHVLQIAEIGWDGNTAPHSGFVFTGSFHFLLFS